jgi:serine/threonine protein kinase
MNQSLPRNRLSAEGDPVLAELVAEITDRLAQGEVVSINDYAGRYPEQAEALRGLFPALAMLNELRATGDDRPAADEPLSGTLGDFRLQREVGRGGMGIVYEAEQISLGRRVALKVLPFAATMDARQRQRFQNEARAAASLDHPHIVPVYGVGCERGVHYYAMKFIDGRSLEQVLAELRGRRQPKVAPASPAAAATIDEHDGKADAADGAVPSPARADTVNDAGGQAPTPLSLERKEYFRRVAELGIQAADALEHAHTFGIVHRDIKPANLMLDSQGQLWVTDFGLARTAADSGLTMTGDLLGTLRYMSPEQALANRVIVDHCTDIYSLGITLYELLVLQPAFDGKDRQEILRQIAFDEPKPPRRLRSNIPAELQTIILKAMEKRPEDRYASVGEMAQDLRRWLEDRPIRARRPGLIQRGRKWGRRHKPLLAAAAIGFILALMGATTGAIVGMLQAREAAETERQARTTAQRSEADIKAVLDFVENRILAAARPEGHEGGLGSDVTLRKALEAALPHVDESFKSQPLLEARLRRTMGLSFRYLGDEQTAASQFELARSLCAGHLGASAPETLAATNNLANSYAALGRHDESLRLRQETLRLRQAELGPDHEQTLDSLSNLALSYQAAGKHDDALRLHEEALARRTAQFGRSHPHTLASRNNVGISYTLLGRHAEAIKLREETLTLMRDRFGPEHPNTLACMNNLAESCQAVGRFADALALYEETLALVKRKLTENHPNTLLVMNNIAWLLATADDPRFRDPARAVQLAEKAAHLSPKSADYWSTLGAARHRAGDCKQAVADLEKALALRGPENSINANESFFLAMACRQLGEHAAARKWFDKGVAWMDSGKSRNDEVRRFRAEAAGLLGIKE